MNRTINRLFLCGLSAVIAYFLLTACNREDNEPAYHTSFGTFVSPGSTNPSEVRIGSVSKGGQWPSFVEWYVTTNVLAGQPRWDGFSKDAPLSPRRACEIALPSVRKEVPQVRVWLVDNIYTRNLFHGGGAIMYSYPNVWCYQITFIPSDPDERAKSSNDGLEFAMTQIVLMDGTLVTPTVIQK